MPKNWPGAGARLGAYGKIDKRWSRFGARAFIRSHGDSVDVHLERGLADIEQDVRKGMERKKLERGYFLSAACLRTLFRI
jgi:hypothetical protein